jgi:hypothetical protein
MHVVECELPPASALGKDAISKAHFHDSYRVPLARPGLTIVEIFFAVHPALDQSGLRTEDPQEFLPLLIGRA